MRTFTLLLVFSWGAAWAESPGLSVDYQTAEGHELVVHVRNLAGVSATAYAIGVSEADYMITDTLLGDRNGRALWPAESTEVRLPLRAVDPDAPRVLAAIFEDGSLAGAPDWLNRIIHIRRLAYGHVSIAMDLMKLAIDQHAERTAALRWFSQWQERYETLFGNGPSPVWRKGILLLSTPDPGDRSAEKPAREALLQFQEWFARLAQSKPAL